MTKAQKIAIPIYLAFLLLSFIVVRSVLNRTPVSQKDQTKPIIVKEVPVTVYLVVGDAKVQKTYTAQRKNTNTVMNLLEYLRNKQGFVFEKLDYEHGTEIDSVFNVSPSLGNKWVVFLVNKDITNEIKNINLTDQATYELKIIPIPNVSN